MCVTERRNISQERYSIREVPVKRGACEERCLRREVSAKRDASESERQRVCRSKRLC